MIPSSVVPNTVRGGLYYPFPYIQDENWLKEQALFWDHLYRIVPTGFRDMEFKGQLVHPTATESAFRDELDFVKDCPVDENKHLHVVGERLLSLMAHSEWFRDQTFADKREYFTWGALEGVKGVYYETVEGFFLTPSRAWRYFPGKVYMALLAKLLSINTGLPVVTDDPEHDLILKTEDVVYDWGEEFHGASRSRNEEAGSAPKTADRTALLYSVILQRIGCVNLEEVSPAKIIDFRRRYDDERRDFADEVQALAMGLKGRTFISEIELQQYISECAEKISRKRQRMIEAMRGSRIETVLRASAVSAPLIAGTVVGGLPQIGAAVGGTLGTAAILYGSRRARRTDMLKDSAVAYLFLMAKKLDTKPLLSRLATINRREWW